MSEFDFLSRIPMGQYLSTGSFLHKLDPRAKIASFLVLILVLTFSQSLIGLGIGLAYLVSLVILSRINLKFALKSVITPLPFLLLFAVIQVFFYSSTKDPNILFSFWIFRITLTGIMAGVIQVFFYSSAKDPNILFSFWIFRITLTGIMAGAILLLRFIALILTLSLATFCISTSEGIQGVQRLLSPLNRLKIKTMDLVMVMQITLRFVPLLTQTAERIAKAQASRGAEWGGKTKGLINRVKQILPLVVPLFVISLRRAENLALAMDARAYGYLDYRTSMVEMKFAMTDALAVLLNLIVSLIILYA